MHVSRVAAALLRIVPPARAALWPSPSSGVAGDGRVRSHGLSMGAAMAAEQPSTAGTPAASAAAGSSSATGFRIGASPRMPAQRDAAASGKPSVLRGFEARGPACRPRRLRRRPRRRRKPRDDGQEVHQHGQAAGPDRHEAEGASLLARRAGRSRHHAQWYVGDRRHEPRRPQQRRLMS